MSDTSAIFSGTSRYSSDFQAVIERAVGIASLSLAQMSDRKTELDGESQALGRLQTRVDAVRSALSSLGSASGPASWSATVSDPGMLRATTGSGAVEGTHTIEITSLGARTSTMSADSRPRVTDPSFGNISAAAGFTLTVDGHAVTVTPESNTLSALAAAINGAGLDVRAVAVNIGTTAAPDYRLSVQGTRFAGTAIQLEDGASTLLDTLATGSAATYKLDGAAITLQSDSRAIEIAPGLSVQMLKKNDPGVETSITISRSTAGISAALNSFCTAYNSAMEEVDKSRGQGSGALAGNSILLEAANGLRQSAQYTDPGAINSLADLGLTFDQNGRLSFDSTVFQATASGRPEALAAFLGSADGGFLKRAGEFLDAIPLDSAKESVSAQIAAQQDRINAEQGRIDEIRTNLVAQMAAADALIASLEQQASYVTNLFEAMRIASQK